VDVNDVLGGASATTVTGDLEDGSKESRDDEEFGEHCKE
jgi:hypothetical protein